MINIKRFIYGLFFLVLAITLGFTSLYFSKVKETRALVIEPNGWEEQEYTLCHNNPAQSITLEFENEQAYEGHLGLPHNDQVYDTEGECEEEFDVCPLVDECIGEEECLSFLQEACEEEGQVEGFQCGDLEEFCEVPHCVLFPNSEECQEPSVTPTPEPTPTEPQGRIEQPTFAQGAPVCVGAEFVKLPANVLVLRNGASAEVRWIPTQGSEANIYYREVGNLSNAHAVRETPNDGTETINLLGSLDWEFSVQQEDGCAASGIVTVIDGNQIRLFSLPSYDIVTGLWL